MLSPAKTNNRGLSQRICAAGPSVPLTGPPCPLQALAGPRSPLQEPPFLLSNCWLQSARLNCMDLRVPLRV